MSIRKFAHEHSSEVLAAFDILLALGILAYGGLFSYYLENKRTGPFFHSWWNLLLVALVAIGGLKIRLAAEERAAAADEKRRIIRAAAEDKKRLINELGNRKKRVVRKLLKAAIKTFASPDPKVKIRALCHTYDTKKDALVPYVAWDPVTWHKDFKSDIPCSHADSEKFVIVAAFRDGAPRKKNLTDAEVQNMPAEVWPELKCVLAAPIQDFDPDAHGEKLGVINFDANRTLEEVNLDDERAAEVCRLYAATIYELLKE